MYFQNILCIWVECPPRNDSASPFVWLSDGTGLAELNWTIPSHTPRNVTDKKQIGLQLWSSDSTSALLPISLLAQFSLYQSGSSWYLTDPSEGWEQYSHITDLPVRIINSNIWHKQSNIYVVFRSYWTIPVTMWNYFKIIFKTVSKKIYTKTYQFLSIRIYWDRDVKRKKLIIGARS